MLNEENKRNEISFSSPFGKTIMKRRNMNKTTMETRQSRYILTPFHTQVRIRNTSEKI